MNKIMYQKYKLPFYEKITNDNIEKINKKKHTKTYVENHWEVIF